jgi:hypothetical protein
VGGGAWALTQSNDQRFVQPALMSFGDECCATLARLIA